MKELLPMTNSLYLFRFHHGFCYQFNDSLQIRQKCILLVSWWCRAKHILLRVWSALKIVGHGFAWGFILVIFVDCDHCHRVLLSSLSYNSSCNFLFTCTKLIHRIPDLKWSFYYEKLWEPYLLGLKYFFLVTSLCIL